MPDQLNERQRQAVTHVHGPLLVIAGAGSGKTRIVTQRICHLIEQGVAPSQILAVTFTNKAAGEMQRRVAQQLSQQAVVETPIICTFHSLGVKLLRESIDRLGYQPHFTIYDEEDATKLLKSCLLTLGIKFEAQMVKSLRHHISNYKNKLITPEEAGPLPQFPIDKIYALYQKKLQESNACDFDDLIYLSVLLLRRDPERLAYYQNRWPYLLIDEYQDTNHVQYLLANLIVARSHNLFVVGDPDQSIYSWRGANIRNILDFEQDHPGAQIIRLEQNYRSCANILKAANALIQNNASRFEKTLWSDRQDGPKLMLFVGRDERDEARFVAQEIEKLHQRGSPLSEMTIFYRTNFQSRIFEDALLMRRLPYTIIGGISFYQRKEIKDILAFLRLTISDTDKMSFIRTLNIPKRGIGDKTIEALLTAISGSITPFCLQPHGIRLTANQKEALHAYGSLLSSLRVAATSLSLHEFVAEVIQKTGYLEFLKEDKETYTDRKENIEELVSKAREWAEEREGDLLPLFLEELSLKSSLDEAHADSDSINLMTLHHGKGLEFQNVFLVGMEEDLFPHINAKDSYDQIEEERRLCYVGMTRAEERLYLSAAELRCLWGYTRRMTPSRFLREIPRSFLERVSR